RRSRPRPAHARRGDGPDPRCGRSRDLGEWPLRGRGPALRDEDTARDAGRVHDARPLREDRLTARRARNGRARRTTAPGKDHDMSEGKDKDAFVKDLQEQWEQSARWNGIKRRYTAEDV